jgi:anaerobic selenocysteine-containing dehydrogenase
MTVETVTPQRRFRGRPRGRDLPPVALASLRQLLGDERRDPALDAYAWRSVRFTPGGDVSLYNAMLHVIVDEGLYDSAYIAAHTEGFEALKASVVAMTPEAMAPACGVAPETLRELARAYASADKAMIFWGMGISQHVHGTDNARCLISLALACGHTGRPGTGLHPLRGQNNVQGASDAGLIPMVLPDYQPVGDAQLRAAFEELWNTDLDPEPGLTVVEIMDAIHAGTIRGMYILGENPAMSDPDLTHARAALARLEHLVVQDLFVTETAQFADVILPASAWPEKDGSVTNTNRQVQLGRAALPLPGEARPDWWIIQEIARRFGLAWDYRHPREVFAEMKQGMASLDHITWERLEREGSVTYPCPADDAPGLDVVFSDAFPACRGTGQVRPRPAAAAGRAHRRRLPHGADHRAPAGALAYRFHDAALAGARRPRARGGGEPGPGRAGAVAAITGRADHPHHPARGDHPEDAGRPADAGGDGVRALRLRGGGGQSPDQPGARPRRQDPRVQVCRLPPLTGGVLTTSTTPAMATAMPSSDTGGRASSNSHQACRAVTGGTR